MKSILNSAVVSSLIGGLGFLGTLGVVAVSAVKDTSSQEEHVVAEAPIWNPKNAEIDLLAAELRGERDAVREKQAKINSLTSQLDEQKKEIEAAKAMVSQMQAEFDKNVVKIRADEQANLKKQVKMYSAMAPESAAKLLNEMEEVVVVKIMGLMKEDESGQILEAMIKEGPEGTRKAAALADRLRKLGKAEEKK